MEKIQWYAEASLVGPSRVFSIGSLAQCVRRWTRLTDEEKAQTYLQYKAHGADSARLESGQIAALAASPELKTV